jgi:hypothetical protein
MRFLLLISDAGRTVIYSMNIRLGTLDAAVEME